MIAQNDLFLAALGFFALFALLGAYVRRHSRTAVDTYAAHLRGQATWAARIFTLSGRALGLELLLIVAFAVFFALHKPLWIPVAIALGQLASQGAVEFFKTIYSRARPDYWLVGLDAGHSYPSGHSCTAVVFFGSWALVTAFGGLDAPARDTVVSFLALWGIGIAWSRLALGAHYLTDVLGGVFFGAAWLCASCAVALRLLAPLLHSGQHAW